MFHVKQPPDPHEDPDTPDDDFGPDETYELGDEDETEGGEFEYE